MPWAFLILGTHAGGREGLARTDPERGHLRGSDIIWIIGVILRPPAKRGGDNRGLTQQRAVRMAGHGDRSEAMQRGT